jgi:hypothetical protein
MSEISRKAEISAALDALADPRRKDVVLLGGKVFDHKPLTPEERKAKEKAEYWAKRNAPKVPKVRELRILVCPSCADQKETRSRAHLGPFVKRGNGLVHLGCPWENKTR